MIRKILPFILVLMSCVAAVAQSNPDDYWLNNGFIDGATVTTNTGYFYDDGGNGLYQENQDWTVEFCSENGNPITLDFSGFRTHFGGTVGDGTYGQYDYMSINYPGAGYVAYNDDTPTFSFTSQSTCITFGFHSDGDGMVDSGWVAEIYAVPPPFNNDPVDAETLVVGNTCSPSFYTNKGAYNSTGLGSPPCKTYFGGDVWFTLVVPPSGVVKIETFPLTLTYAILDIFRSSDNNILASERIACVDDNGVMPAVTLSGPTVSPGDRLYIRVFGEQAKSGLFGICATDPNAPVTGFTGPGGVGDSISLDFWFRTDRGVLNESSIEASDGERIASWIDQSGNGSDLDQSTSGFRPQFNENALHGFGSIGFDGSDDFMSVESGSGDAPLHWFAVGSFSGTQRQTMFSIGDASSTKTASVGRHTDGRYFSFTGTDLYGPVLTDGESYLIHAIHNNNSPFHFLQLNGLSQAVDADPGSLESDGSFTLGASWDDVDPFNGAVSELIQYRKTLNSAQQIIINNYLAAKYDLPLAANDLYSFRNSFHYDVAGIGRIDADNQHTKAQSAGILAISSASDLDNGEFVLFGHDDGDFSSWTAANVPENDTNIVRLERLWRIDLEGDPGTVTITLDKEDLPALPEGFAAYNIIVDENTDFTSGASTYGPFELGSELVINNAVFADGDYLAIAAVRPVISFLNSSSEALESVANPTIEVNLNYAISSIVDIDYQVVGATATQGTDYSLNASTISINPGSKSNDIIPLIIDDSDVEIPDEYFDIQISTTTTGVIASGIVQHRHTILNDDMDINVARSKDTIGECITSTALLTVSPTGTGPFSYAWTPVAGILDDPTNDTVTVSPSATTLYTIEVSDGLGQTFSDTVRVWVVPVPEKPGITASDGTDLCSGDSVRLSAPQGYSAYLWSGLQTTPDIWVSEAGSYNVTVIDSFGCAGPVSDDVFVTVNPLPDPPGISADGPLSFCEGGSVTLEASGSSVLYTWTDDITGQSRVVSAAGAYAVKATDVNGCTSEFSDTVVVAVFEIPDPPAIEVSGSLSFCAGDSALLIGPPGFDGYLWSDGSTNDTLVAKQGGTYTLAVISSEGCLSDPSSAVEVTVHPLPDPPDLVAEGPASFCEGGSVTLSAEAGYESYLWSTGGAGPSLDVTSSGDYFVIGTDANGCSSEPSGAITVTVHPLPPAPEITPAGEIYLITGDSVVLSASIADSYLWSPGGQTTREITIKESGTYSVIVENEFECLSPPSEDVVVVVSNFLAPPNVDVSGPLAFCEGEAVTLTGENGFSVYRWSDGVTGQSREVTVAGTYTLVVEDAEGRESFPSDEVTITVYELPEIVLQETIEPLCNGDDNGSISINLSGGTAPYTFEWSNGSSEEDPVGLVAGTYSVVATDANECTGQLEVLLDQPDALAVEVTETPAYCPDVSDGALSLVVSGGVEPYSYAWEAGGIAEILTDLSPGTYPYSVTDANGCMVEETVTLGYTNDVCFVIPEIITPNSDGYNDRWYIEGLEVYPDVTIDVFDRWGRKVFHSEGHDTYFDGTYNGKDLPMESYHYVIDLQNGTEKIIGNLTIIRGE
jgi:gliding motility-associated-like protein